jgi:hypothetical protein
MKKKMEVRSQKSGVRMRSGAFGSIDSGFAGWRGLPRFKNLEVEA